MCLIWGREPGCAPGGAVTFSCLAKRKSPKRRRPYCACPFAALRATCDARAGGAPQNSLRACSAPFKQLRRVSARSACVLRHTHAPPALRFSARTEGNPQPDIHTGHRFARPRLRGRKRLALARQAERSDGPCGCWAPTPPSGCACGAQGMADQGSRLSERRRREFERDPASTEHRRLRVIGVRHPFHCGAQHRTLRASRRLGELGL